MRYQYSDLITKHLKSMARLIDAEIKVYTVVGNGGIAATDT